MRVSPWKLVYLFALEGRLRAWPGSRGWSMKERSTMSSRGERRQAIYGDDEDRRMFVELMGQGFPHHVLRCQLIEQIQPELHTA